MRTRSQSSRRSCQLPVTILSGFLGSGKTTLLKRILEEKGHSLRVAVIVNDMSELNIDASLVKNGSLVQTEEKLVEMQNGCICCTLREDLLIEVRNLASTRNFDYLLIESTGIGEPQQVAETFEMEDSDGRDLRDVAFIDTMVTLVDSSNVLRNLSSIKNVAQQEGRDVAGGERQVADLLLDQMEFANVVLLNKSDLVDDATRNDLEKFLKTINPGAVVRSCIEAKIPLDTIINTGLFDMDEARKSAGWLMSLTEGHAPETEEYGISSFIYRARRPFHPQKLWEFFTEHWMLQEVVPSEEADDEDESGVEMRTQNCTDADSEGKQALLFGKFGQVLRSKGFIWLAGRNDLHGELSQAGSVLRVSPGAPWFSAIPEDMWADVDPKEVKKDMCGRHGDRRQEIVFIGIDMKKDLISRALDDCLCPPDDSGPAEDPFLKWPMLEIVEVSTDTDMD